MLGANTPQGETVGVLAIAFIILTLVVVGLRIWSRHLSGAGLWWDDYMILVTLFFVTASNATRFWFVRYGLGKHIQDVAPEDVSQLFKVLWADMYLYNFCISMTKLSAIAFYYRTFPSPKLRRFVQIYGAIILIWLFGSCMTVLLQCSPIYKFWDQEAEGTCVDFVSYILGQAVPNIALDFGTLSLPIPLLLKLQISTGKKLAIIMIFLIGYTVTAVSIVRTVVILQINPTLHHDVTFNFYYPNLWSSIEQAVGLVCVCLPAMGILLRRLSIKVKESTFFTATSSSVWSPSTSKFTAKIRNSDSGSTTYLHGSPTSAKPGGIRVTKTQCVNYVELDEC